MADVEVECGWVVKGGEKNSYFKKRFALFTRIQKKSILLTNIIEGSEHKKRSRQQVLEGDAGRGCGSFPFL